VIQNSLDSFWILPIMREIGGGPFCEEDDYSPKITVKEICRATVPCCILDFAGISLVLLFPAFATWF